MYFLIRLFSIALSCATLLAICNCGQTFGTALDQNTRQSWLDTPIDSSSITYRIGIDPPWDSPAILFFNAERNLDGLNKSHAWRFEQQTGNDCNYLSNYWPQEIIVDDRMYKSSEHYYQAIKFEIDGPIYNAIVEASTPSEAKAIAHAHAKEASLGDDQEMSRRMKRALWAKFISSEGVPNGLGQKLLETGECLIVEGNRRISADGRNISDRRWGMEFDFSNMPETATLTGQNLLGKLLMELRDYLLP